MMKVFISGKISGNEMDYLRLFQEAEDYLTEIDLVAVNPTKLDHNHDLSWESYMRVDLRALLDCDGIFMLKDWKESKGSKLEHSVAENLKLKILYQSQPSSEIIDYIWS